MGSQFLCLSSDCSVAGSSTDVYDSVSLSLTSYVCHLKPSMDSSIILCLYLGTDEMVIPTLDGYHEDIHMASVQWTHVVLIGDSETLFLQKFQLLQHFFED